MKWLNRSLMDNSHHYGLCTSEKDFKRELKRMGLPPESWPQWIANEHSDATVHYLEHESGNKAALVCIRLKPEHTGIQVASLLVHEAVHIWQAHCEVIGEKSPGSEQEAYAIQRIAQELMQAYSDAVS